LKFNEFGFDERLMEGIDASGYEDATPVQEQVIPLIMAGKDVIASAQTGTGKTAAFLLPLINKIITDPHEDHTNNTLVIVPTRELAIQIAQHMEGLSYFTSVSSIAVFGGGDGNAFVQEKKALSHGADVVICTPGKMMAHIKMGYVKLDGLKYLVLDEADRMLDMGFYDDIMFIINHLPKKRQNLLFSATMPHKIREMARKILHQPVEINISISKPPEKIIQEAFIVYDTQKIPLVKYLLRKKDFKSVLIFCSSKISVKQLTRELKRSGLPADEIHSDLEQTNREDVLMKFKSGIDIDNIDLVINYDVPHDGEDYVHRIGRTARAEADGTAYTFVSVKEQRKFLAIEKLLGKPVPKATIPAEFGETPEFNTATASRHSGGDKRNFKRPMRSGRNEGNRRAH
jgi:ATP-dependent RNA helicase RhlE